MKIDTRRLNVARMKAGLTIDDVSRLAGISYWSAYQTFRGRSAAPAKVVSICKTLKISVDDVLLQPTR